MAKTARATGGSNAAAGAVVPQVQSFLTDTDAQIDGSISASVFMVDGAPLVNAATQRPDDQNLLTWTYDPMYGVNNALTVSGTLYLLKVLLRKVATITTVTVGLTTQATTPTANQNFLGLYDSAGNRVASTAAGAIDAATTSAGPLTGTMASPYAAPIGAYWVALLFNAATPPTVMRASGQSAGTIDAGLAAAGFRFAVNGAGLTALPASITPSSNTHTSASSFWAGVA